MAFIPEIEKKSLQEQWAFQKQKIGELLLYLNQYSPFYKNTFLSHNINVLSFDIEKEWCLLPTTGKEDIQEHNDDFLCISRKSVAEYTTTSGTLGRAVTIALSSGDLDRLAYNELLSFHCMNLTENDIVQLMLTLDRQFMAGMAYYSGLRRLGAASIRSGPALPLMQWQTMDQMQSTALVTVPSFLLKMLQQADEMQVSPGRLPVKKILAIGERIRDENLEDNVLATRIRSLWNVELYSTYASTEMQTAFTECNQFNGGHHHPELIYVELLDEKGNQVKEGENGEVTITTLGVEAMPLLRYRTGDICTAFYEPCACGRKTMRLGPVLGRKKQMIKYKGTTVFPNAIFDLMQQSDFVVEYQLEVFSNEYHQDELLLHLHTTDKTACEDALKPLLQSRLRVMPALSFHSMESMQQRLFTNSSRKPRRFLDNRTAFR